MPAEFLLLRAIYPKDSGDGGASPPGRDQLERAGLIDDIFYRRGLELVGLDRNLEPVNRRHISVSADLGRSIEKPASKVL